LHVIKANTGIEFGLGEFIEIVSKILVKHPTRDKDNKKGAMSLWLSFFLMLQILWGFWFPEVREFLWCTLLQHDDSKKG